MATGTTAQQIIDVVTPAAGESVSEGTILEWHVKVGDVIRATDTIVEISTDKVDLELPSPASGTVTEILIEEGETVTVGQVIARIAAGDAPAGDGAAAEAPAPSAESPSPAAEAPARSAESPASGPPDAPPQPAAEPAGGTLAAPQSSPSDEMRTAGGEQSGATPVAARA